MSYTQNAHRLYLAHANATQAASMKQYMRNQFEFLGINSPERKLINQHFWNEKGLPTVATLPAEVEKLWQLPEREFQYLAMDTSKKMAPKVAPDHISTLEYMLKHKQWWDTVDLIAGNLVGEHLQKFPRLINSHIPKWQDANDIWLNRTAILFQLKYKEETNTDLLTQSILKHRHSNEFFIQKAIGWALRQYAKTDHNWVKHFLKTYELANLSKKEAAKNMK